MIGVFENAEDLQSRGMRKANRGERWQPGLSKALLWFRVPHYRQAGASASEKIARGEPAMLPLRKKTDARCFLAASSGVWRVRETFSDGRVKLQHAAAEAFAALVGA